ncbi:MAG TPA: hypothetical protein VMW91_09140 [Desulfosporosinus sp.]|nr:hypothetical protein [Desulfosporosinus sp.]
MKQHLRLAILRTLAHHKTAMTSKDERTIPTLAKSLFNSLKTEGMDSNEMMELVGDLMDLIAQDIRTPSSEFEKD